MNIDLLPLSFSTMEEKHAILSSSLIFLILSNSIIFSNSLHYQPLILRSLPLPIPLSLQSTPQISQITTKTTPEKDSSSTILSLDLHHLDSLSSNSTPLHLFSLRLHRDATRASSIISSVKIALKKGNGKRKARDFSSSVMSGLAMGSGEYFTRLGVGTPARYLYVVLDTGSDVVWIQCKPCKKCYSQSDPVFDPKSSTTFAKVACSSPLCKRLEYSACNRKTKTCLYQVSYGDGSFTVGDFSTETLTFRRNRVKKVAIGCGHDNQGLFVGAAGLLGLGRGRLSFPVQTGHRFSKKFSYCLVDRSASSAPSSIIFGNSSVSSKARFTPLLTNSKLDTFYYLGLIGISVGGNRVKGISSSLFKIDKTGNGGVIIDSGTSVTRLTQPAYLALRNEFRKGSSDLKRAPDFSLFDTCYDLRGIKEVNVPTVSLHFVGGADVLLPASNYLIPVDNEGTFCFAFAGTTSGLSIIGNIQQQGIRVVYDLAANRVGFTPNGCA